MNGMYDEYVKKIEKRVRRQNAAKKWLKKHIVHIVVFVAFTVAAAAAIMYFSGTYLRKLSGGGGVYGDIHSAGTNAFLSRVSYSVTENSGSENAAAIPVPDPSAIPLKAGNYKLEAKTVNPFGIKRTQEINISIEKRSAAVSLMPITFAYGDDPSFEQIFAAGAIRTENLAPGDNISRIEFDYDALPGDREVRICALTVVNAAGEDVTDSYLLTLSGARWEITKRPVTIRSGDAEKIFDRGPAGSDVFEISEKGPAPGDEIIVTFDGEKPVDPGTYDNVFSVNVLRDGYDVTDRYEIVKEFGKLTVNKIELLISSKSANKLYDGKPFGTDEYGFAIKKGELLDGDEITFIPPEKVTAGTFANKPEVLIYDTVEGREVTEDHYVITYDTGVITIEKRSITLRSQDGEPFVYDAEYHDFREVNITEGTLAEGDTIFYRNFARIVHSGEFKNTFSEVIYGPSGDNVHDSYNITHEYGTIKVEKRNVTIEIGFFHRGHRPEYWATAKVIKGSIAGEDHYEIINSTIPDTVKIKQLPELVDVKITNWNDRTERTNDYNIDIVFDIDEEELLRQKRESHGIDVDNDDHSEPASAVSSPEIPLEGFAPDDKTVLGIVRSRRSGQIYLRLKSYWQYEYTSWGEPAQMSLFNSGAEGNDPVNFLHFTLIRNGFRPVNEVTVKDLMKDGITPVPYFAYGIPAGGSDEISLDGFIPGEYRDECAYNQITGLSTTVLAGLKKSYYGEYDNLASIYKILPDDTASRMREILADAGLLYERNSPDIIEKVADFIRFSAKYNLRFEPIPDGEDPVIYFLTESKEGICTHFASAATVAYRAMGIPARYTTGFLVNATDTQFGNSYTGANAHAWVEVYVNGVGWVPVEVTPSASGENGVPGNPGGDPSFVTPDPEQIITYNVLYVTMESRSKKYDGEPLFSEKTVVRNPELLKPGHTVSASSKKILFSGSLSSMPEDVTVTDSEGNDVTDQYVIETEPFELIIEPANYYLDSLVLYVGETISEDELLKISSEELAALTHTDMMDRSVLELLQGIQPDGSGYVVCASAGEYILYSDYDFGNNSNQINIEEATVRKTVKIEAFRNVRVNDAPADAEKLEGALMSDAPVTVRGENGRTYTYLEISALSARKEFDAEYLTKDGYIILSGCLKPGHRIDYQATGSQLYVGSSMNSFKKLRIIDEDGTDVTNEYLIDFYPALLTVAEGKYVLKEDAEKLYVDVDSWTDISGKQWVENVDNVPAEYRLSPVHRGNAELSGGKLLGVNPGSDVIDVRIIPVDLNGDGVNEFGEAALSVPVSVKKADNNLNVPLLTAGTAAGSALFGAVIFLLLRTMHKKRKEAEYAR